MTCLQQPLIALAFVAFGTMPAYPEGPFTDRPIRIVVPFSPGGPAEVVVRPLAELLSADLGQSLVVENVSGAGGTLGTALVVRANPDGLTLLAGTPGPTVTASAMYPELTYDPATDLVPVALLFSSPHLLSVHPSVPATTLGELVAFAQAQAGTLNFASPGIGTLPHLVGEQLKATAGFEATHVPYTGGEAVLAIVSGDVQFSFESAPAILPHVDAGDLRLIATAGRERLPQAPDIATTAEQGFPEVLSSFWIGIFAPVGTPAEIVETLNTAFNAGMRSPEIERMLPRIAATARPGTPAEFEAFLAEERARWIPLIEALELSAQ